MKTKRLEDQGHGVALLSLKPCQIVIQEMAPSEKPGLEEPETLAWLLIRTAGMAGFMRSIYYPQNKKDA